MGLGAVLEPLIVVSLLAGGTLLNRDKSANGYGTGTVAWNQLAPRFLRHKGIVEEPNDIESARSSSDDDVIGLGTWSWQKNGSSTSLSSSSSSDGGTGPERTRRERTLRFFRWRATVLTPNTAVFKDRLLSRILRRFPFLVEAWYWALIYWVRVNNSFCLPTLLRLGGKAQHN